MDRRLWHEAYEQVETRILLNLQKLREHNEQMRQAIHDAERRRSRGGSSSSTNERPGR